MENLTTFEPIVLQRPMKLFKDALMPARAVNVAMMPSPEFLVRLFSDELSHASFVRRHIGKHFKNFENFVRGRNEPSKTTLSNLSMLFNSSEQELRAMVHGKADGALVPQYLNFFVLLEELAHKLYLSINNCEVRCAHCNADIMKDQEIFWSKWEVKWSESEYRFSERILGAAVGGVKLMMLILQFRGLDTKWDDYVAMARSERHPIGNWLFAIRTERRVDSLKNLATEMQLMADDKCHVPYERLKKWSAGSDLMPVAVAEALIKNGSKDFEPKGIQLAAMFYIARAVSLVVDFLYAASIGGEPERLQVQKIVEARFGELVARLDLSLHLSAKEAEKKLELVGNSVSVDDDVDVKTTNVA